MNHARSVAGFLFYFSCVRLTATLNGKANHAERRHLPTPVHASRPARKTANTCSTSSGSALSSSDLSVASMEAAIAGPSKASVERRKVRSQAKAGQLAIIIIQTEPIYGGFSLWQHLSLKKIIRPTPMTDACLQLLYA